MKLFLTLGLFSSTLLMSPSLQPEPIPRPTPTLCWFEIDGTKLTLADFERKRPAGLFQARNAFYEAERKGAGRVR